MTTGVRVGAVDADGDGQLDVLAGRAPGGGEVRAYTPVGGGQLFALTPFGGTFDKGSFVAGDARPVPGVGILSGGLPDVSITAHTDGAEGGAFTVTFARTGPTTSSLGFTLSYGGTATFADYNSPLAFVFNVGQSSTTATFDMSSFWDDALVEGTETAVITVQSNPGSYDAGSPASVTVALIDNDGPGASAPAAAAGGTAGCVDQYGDAVGSPRTGDLLFRPDRDGGGINQAMPDYVDDPVLGLALAWCMVNVYGGRDASTCSVSQFCPSWTVPIKE